MKFKVYNMFNSRLVNRSNFTFANCVTNVNWMFRHDDVEHCVFCGHTQVDNNVRIDQSEAVLENDNLNINDNLNQHRDNTNVNRIDLHMLMQSVASYSPVSVLRSPFMGDNTLTHNDSRQDANTHHKMNCVFEKIKRRKSSTLHTDQFEILIANFVVVNDEFDVDTCMRYAIVEKYDMYIECIACLSIYHAVDIVIFSCGHSVCVHCLARLQFQVNCFVCKSNISYVFSLSSYDYNTLQNTDENVYTDEDVEQFCCSRQRDKCCNLNEFNNIEQEHIIGDSFKLLNVNCCEAALYVN
ncbi:hypothetical protein B4U80_13597 [Leptotrombidium deliense]|uniref:RING-type domain-containing protein n=1 Tax=Leptotrombidium deliense TaxID=299467 RepID=A0A443SV59_9ACAR|nr:hypothetical protein B4U80_13597 [Leptotrombidium deliense]